MGLRNVIKGIGRGSMFGHGRILGVHNPFGSAIGKARDPFINLRTLARLSSGANKNIRTEAAKNLAQRLKSRKFNLKLLSIFNIEVIREVLTEVSDNKVLKRVLDHCNDENVKKEAAKIINQKLIDRIASQEPSSGLFGILLNNDPIEGLYTLFEIWEKDNPDEAREVYLKCVESSKARKTN
jgi:hypothetical protein